MKLSLELFGYAIKNIAKNEQFRNMNMQISIAYYGIYNNLIP